jgi:type I restriction enzyme M protein
MAKLIEIRKSTLKNITLYDPTCGSGSLLLKAADEAQSTVTIYGQEMDNATSALAKMNMILHNNPTASIWKDNVLSSPHFTNPKDGTLKTFDYVVANFPFSIKSWSNGLNPSEDTHKRFEDGIPPQKNGDYAFLLHILRSLKSTGTGAVILPHGVLFRGGAEGEIRKNLIRKGYIKGIIGLPANLFFGTGIPACIIILDKENAAGRKGIFMINASQGFMKDGNKNRLRHQDIHKIVDVFTRQVELPKYARMVPLAEISDPKNDYNLNIPRYIDNTAEEDMQDIEAHLLGGIPDRDIENLAAYWNVFGSLRKKLFTKGSRKGYSEIKVEAAQVKPAIFTHPEFEEFNQATIALFKKWAKKSRPILSALKVGSHPKALIEALSEDLLTTFAKSQLVDPYDVYQRLMTYWVETMQDDVYMIVTEDWTANSELIPPTLLTARYFKQEQKDIENLSAKYEALIAQIRELNEEYSGEDNLFSAIMNDKGRISTVSLKVRLKELASKNGQSTAEDKEEFNLLNRFWNLLEASMKALLEVNISKKELNEKVNAKYTALKMDEIKTLVIEDKWIATMSAAVDAEIQNIASQLASRLKELAERYIAPLSELVDDVDTLTSKVDAHLKSMGFAWM